MASGARIWKVIGYVKDKGKLLGNEGIWGLLGNFKDMGRHEATSRRGEDCGKKVGHGKSLGDVMDMGGY